MHKSLQQPLMERYNKAFTLNYTKHANEANDVDQDQLISICAIC